MRDAEEVNPDRHGRRKVSPQYPPSVWAWRDGWVRAWFQDQRGQWYAWLFYDVGEITHTPALFV